MKTFLTFTLSREYQRVENDIVLLKYALKNVAESNISNIFFSRLVQDVSETKTTLTDDLTIFKNYFRTWKLNPYPTKAHLNYRLANLKLKMYTNGFILNHIQRSSSKVIFRKEQLK